MWNDTPFEDHLKKGLRELDQFGLTLEANYVKAKSVLVAEIYEEIRAKEPNLSDHGPRHIENVLRNIWLLCLKDISYFSIYELYIIGLVVLFHDVGNIHGRDQHNNRIRDIYIHATGGNDREEMRLVLQAARAHTGKATDGGKDTLKELEGSFHFRSNSIRLSEIAAIVRIADELAEGPQRTSLFRLRNDDYPGDSEIYHRYAKSVKINIDRSAGRFALTFDIEVVAGEPVTDDDLKSSIKLIEFSCQRLSKLDQERRYAAFYCPFLATFRMTSAKFYFWINDQPHELDLPNIAINDKVVPGDPGKAVTEHYPELHVEAISKKLRALCGMVE